MKNDHWRPSRTALFSLQAVRGFACQMGHGTATLQSYLGQEGTDLKHAEVNGKAPVDFSGL